MLQKSIEIDVLEFPKSQNFLSPQPFFGKIQRNQENLRTKQLDAITDAQQHQFKSYSGIYCNSFILTNCASYIIIITFLDTQEGEQNV